MSTTKNTRPKGYKAESQNKTFEADVCDCITLEEYGIKNVRVEYPDDTYKDLKESVRADGIKETMHGFRHPGTNWKGEAEPKLKGKIVIFKGHHRIKCGREIETEENRPVRGRVQLHDVRKWKEADFIAEMYSENSLRAEMSVYENAITVKRLVEAGLTHEEVAKRLSKYRVDGYLDLAYVRNGLIICEAPTSILDLVKAGDLAASEVVKLRKKSPDWKTVEEIVTKAQEKRDEVLSNKTAPSKQRSKKIMTRHITQAASSVPQAENLANSARELKRFFKSCEKRGLSGKDISDPTKREVWDKLREIENNSVLEVDINKYFFNPQ